MTSQSLSQLARSPKTAAQAKVIQWLQRPKEARIGRILEKFKDNAPEGWPPTWSAVFEHSTGISEWPVKQFHEFENVQLDSSAFLLKGFLSEDVQIMLIQAYREAMRTNKLRMTPPDKVNKTVGTANLGWRKQIRGYGEPKADIPDFIYDLSQLAIKTLDSALPALGEKRKCSAFLQHFDCYSNQDVEVPLHVEDSEDSELFESGQPLVIFSLGCQASFNWRSTKHPIKSGDVILFGKESRLMQFGIGEVIPDTEPQLPTLTTPFRGTTILTVRQVKA